MKTSLLYLTTLSLGTKFRAVKGGRIGLANWTPESFIGQLFRTLGKYLPPPPGVRPPALWGTPGRLEELFDGGGRIVAMRERSFQFRYCSALHWVHQFRTYHGPVNRAFAALEGARLSAFTRDLIELVERGNRSGDETLVLPSEYLEVVIEKRAWPSPRLRRHAPAPAVWWGKSPVERGFRRAFHS